jgi:NTE family protein
VQISANTETTIEKASAAREPSFALALGGGGARGICHIHVIEVMNELGLVPRAIAGSSIGAILGAAMAAGLSGSEIRAYALDLLGKRGGIVANRIWQLGASSMRSELDGFRLGQFNLQRILEKILPETLPKDFSALKLPLKVMATDYYAQSEVVITEGDLHLALAASAAIPALFMPVRIGGRIMIDGGIFNPVPYEHLMDNSDIVIGVDVVGGPEGDGSTMPNRLDSLVGASQLMMQATVALKLRLRSPQVYLRPPVNRFKVMDFLKIQDVLTETECIKDEMKRAIEREVEAFYRKGRG